MEEIRDITMCGPARPLPSQSTSHVTMPGQVTCAPRVSASSSRITPSQHLESGHNNQRIPASPSSHPLMTCGVISNKYSTTQPLDYCSILLGQRKTLSLRNTKGFLFSTFQGCSRLIVAGIYGLRKDKRDF